MKLEGVIFDIDGTLCDTIPFCIETILAALEEGTGKKYEKEVVLGYFGATEEGIVKKLAPENWQTCYDAYLRLYAENHHKYPSMFEGITNILNFVKNSELNTAVVTGKGEHSAKITLDYYGIKDYFSYIESGSPEGSIKSQCMSAITSRWGINPKNVIYIGDATRDVLDSRTAGLIPVSVTWASNADKEALSKLEPDFMFDKVSDLHEWLKSMVKSTDDILQRTGL